MTVIGVSKVQMTTYASDAEMQFGTIKSSLEGLIQDCVNVKYWGENAASFKAAAGKTAVEMGEDIGRSMKAFLRKVNDQTSAIAKSLGGGDMTVDITVPTFTMPAVPTSDAGTQGADTNALDSLQTSVNGHRDKLNTAVDEHQAALGRTTEWTGNGKQAAVSACTTFTTEVSAAVTTNIGKLTTFISEQKSAVEGADA